MLVLRVVELWVVSLCQEPQAHGLWGGPVHVLRLVELRIVQSLAPRQARARDRAGEVPVLRVFGLWVVQPFSGGAARALREQWDETHGTDVTHGTGELMGGGGAGRGRQREETKAAMRDMARRRLSMEVA